MDHQLRIQHNPIHYVLFLLAVQWGRVLPMPILNQSVCNSALPLTEILQHEASQLLDNYVLIHQFQADSIPEDVPDAKVNGNSPAEKLYSIAVQEMRFYQHLMVVKNYTTDFWANPDPSLQDAFETAIKRLSKHYQMIGELLNAVDPNFNSPTMPASPAPSIEGGYANKHYGWGVLSNLKVLLNNVEQELKSVCGEELQNL
ncbi:uncharacterized protein LOC132459872 isoform X2 [Gadus macrocephalus]|uniref:uncharacterized protein LOC132459872 isoform X2 n=1 Tax=Gadus macrocephalus TaxID=80720 RepID=UPI0028CB9869|nr:uncharacterized protein LOC132459872 isoform X2 [Gadus macrocephalus]